MNRIQSSFKNPITMTILNTIKTTAAGYKTVTHCVFDMDGLLLGKASETEVTNIQWWFFRGISLSWSLSWHVKLWSFKVRDKSW